MNNDTLCKMGILQEHFDCDNGQRYLEFRDPWIALLCNGSKHEKVARRSATRLEHEAVRAY